MKKSIFSVLLFTIVAISVSAQADEPAEKTADQLTLKDLRSRTISLSKEVLPEEALRRSMEGYQAFLASPLGGAMRREALRRVADQMIQQLELQEEAIVEETQDAMAAPLIEDASYDKAIEYYNEALNNYPVFPGNEHILYQLARAYEANAEPKQAIWSLKKIASVYPKCEYVDEAIFRIAELSFLTRQYDQATSHYQRIIDKGDTTQFYKISIYKAGWSQFKKKNYKASLDQFIALLDYVMTGISVEDMFADMPQLSAGEQEMIKDTLRVMSIAFTHQEEPLEYMKSYLAGLEQPRDYEFKIYTALADMYFFQELYLDAANVYQAFARKYHNHPQAPFFHLMAAETFSKGRFYDEARESLKAFAGTYGLQSNFWSADKPKNLKEQLTPYLRQYLSELAQHYHAELQKEFTEGNKQQALHWYRAYLKSFPKDEEAAHINFLLAELLFQTEDYKAAALEYNKTAYNYGKHTEAQEAGYAAILAFDKHKENLLDDELEAWRHQSVENALQFAKVYHNDERVPGIVTKTAQDLFDVGAYDTAIKAASIVLALRNKPVEMEHSAQLVLGHSYFEKQLYAQAENAYKGAIKLIDKKAEGYQPIYERIAASIYRQGEQQKEKNNLRGTIREFLRVINQTPNAEIRDTAEYDAATAMLAIKDWKPAITILEAIRERPFGIERTLAITQKLTVAYLETGADRKAAAELEKLAQLDGNYDVQREAVWRAAELYEKAGDINGTISAFEGYVKKFTAPLDANVEARYKLAQLHKSQNNMQGYTQRLKDVIATDGEAGNGRTDRTRYLAGQSALALADIAFENYAAIKLVEPVKKNLKKKKTSMQSTIKAYSSTSDYGIAELTTNATFHIAEIYRDFAKALLASERPNELKDPDELEMYNLMLEEQAFPFEEKAIDLHEKNYLRIKDGVYDKWVKRSLRELANINPGRYDKVEKSEAYIEILN